jgi:hypothetical protein
MVVMVGLAAGLPGRSAGDEPGDAARVEAFLREYRAQLPLLLERYSTNRKIRYRLTEYESRGGSRLPIGRVISRGEYELVTDGMQIRRVPVEKTFGRRYHQFWRPDVQFNVIPKDRGGFDLMIPATRVYAKHNYYESVRYDYFAHEPLRAGGDTLSTAHWFEEFAPVDAAVKVVDVRETTWRNRPCLEVRSRCDNGGGRVEVASTYLDRENPHVTIGTESDWRVDPSTEHEERYRRVEEIEYQPSAEGYPLPRRSRRTHEYERGRSRKVLEVEFLAYERYRPSPEEFRLEEQYGLSTPPVIPADSAAGAAAELVSETAPERPGEIRRWVVLGAVGALVVALVLFVRRTTRRPGGRSEPSSAG